MIYIMRERQDGTFTFLLIIVVTLTVTTVVLIIAEVCVGGICVCLNTYTLHAIYSHAHTAKIILFVVCCK